MDDVFKGIGKLWIDIAIGASLLIFVEDIRWFLMFLFIDVLDFGITQNKIPYLKIDTVQSRKLNDTLLPENNQDTGIGSGAGK